MDKHLLTQLYVYENKEVKEIAEVFGVHRKTMGNWIKREGLVRCFQDPEWIQEMYFEKRLRHEEMAQIANCSISRIRHYFQLNGFNRRPNRTHHFDESIFHHIDSEEKAYWLGFLLADGSVSIPNSSSYRLSLFLKSSDLEHIEKFKSFLGTSAPIIQQDTVSPSTRKATSNHGVKINSKQLVADLINHGIEIRKTGKEAPPRGVPGELTLPFVRGYFDGDGSLGIYTNKSKNVFYPSLTLIGTRELLEWIQEQLGVQCTITQQGKLHRFQCTGEKARLIAHKLYDGASIYLSRKHSIFTQL